MTELYDLKCYKEFCKLLYQKSSQGANMGDECIKIITVITLVVATIALFVNFAALIYVIKQTAHSKISIDLNRKSIDDANSTRQISLLQKSQWIINVLVMVEMWQKQLEETAIVMRNAKRSNDIDALKKLSTQSVKNPKDLTMHRSHYEKMPPWLRELWISGAQYFYNASSPVKGLWSERHGANFDLIDSLLSRFDESIVSLQVLQGYLNDMVPQVILNTPSSLSEDDFLID